LIHVSLLVNLTILLECTLELARELTKHYIIHPTFFQPDQTDRRAQF